MANKPNNQLMDRVHLGCSVNRKKNTTMKQLNLLWIFTLLIFIFNTNTRLQAEGTPQLSPTVNDLALLSINSSFGITTDFAYYGSGGTAQGLCFDVVNPSETVYLGLGLEVNTLGDVAAMSSYSFRIVDSGGNTVHGPFTVNSGNANGTNYNQLVNGPNIGAITGGYSIANSNYVFNPSTSGTYCIEFDRTTFEPSSGGYIKNIDVSIANGAGNIQDGRLYSQNWAFRTPCNPSFGCTPTDGFDKSFEGKVYVLTADNFVESIDFAGSGFRGLGFRLAFNGSGPGMTGDPEVDRRSLNASNTTNPDFKIYVNDPDMNTYDPPVLSNIVGSPTIVNQSISCDAMSNFCVDVTVGEPGLVQILFDLNGNDEMYTPGTADAIVSYRFEDGMPLTTCIPWDGLDGFGNPVDVNTAIPVAITYYQGEVHFMQADVEYNNPGFVVALEHPSGGTFQSNHYWDDTNIDASGDDDANIDGDNNAATNPPGTPPNPPFIELTGQAQPSHIWNRNTSSTSIGYGESNVINTWWFGHASVNGSVALTPCPTAGEIEVTKEILAAPVPAASGVQNNYDVTYSYEICNTNLGGLAISQISLVDNFASQFGAGFIGVTTPPVISTPGSDGTTADPTANALFNGNAQDNLLNADGGIDGGECITVQVTVEVDASNLPYPTQNTATATAADDGEGNPTTDDSDDATDIDGDTNPYNETGGTMDPTLLVLPEINTVKRFSGASTQADGDFTLNFEITVTNTGNTYLNTIALSDALSFLPGAAPMTQNIVVSVTNVSADMAPSANPAYDGTGDIDLLLGSDGQLAPGQEFTVSISVDVDPIAWSALPMPVTNQATASGIPTDNTYAPINDPETGMPYAVGVVSDLSDDNTPGIADAGTPDDPTPLTLPSLSELTKELLSVTSATTPGNANAAYSFNFCNVGANDLMQLQIADNLNSQFGSGFVGVVSNPALGVSTATTNPSLAAVFTGFSPNDNFFDGSSGVLAPGECIEVLLTIEVDVDELPDPAQNQATASGTDANGITVTDLSDDATDLDGDTNNDNETGGEDDPTGFPVSPAIGVAKSVNLVTTAPTPDHYFVTYRHIIQNTGNTALENLSLTDDVATALCGGYIGTTAITVLNIDASTAPSAAAGTTAMNGTNDALGNDGLLLPGQSFIVDITVEADITATTCNQPYLNQSTAEGLPTDGAGTALNDPSGAMYVANDITDLSDSGTDADGSNPGAPNDGNGLNIYDDPTPLQLPGTIGLVKSITNIVPAASGIERNYDVTIQYYIENTDGNNLTNITLTDAIGAQWGAAFVGVTTNPTIAIVGADGTTTDPTANTLYNGTSDLNLLNNDGELSPGESITVQVVVEVDPSESPVDGLTNQATVSGTDPNGNVATDLSDDNTNSPDAPDADGDNPNADGNNGTGGTNDPTPLSIGEIGLSKALSNIEPSTTAGNSLLTFTFIIENTGTVALNNLKLNDDFVQRLNDAWVGVTSGPTITSSTADVDPTLVAYTGGNGIDGFNENVGDNMFNNISGLIQPGQQITVEVVVEVINGNLDNVQVNAAVARGDDPNGLLVQDASYDGFDPQAGTAGPPAVPTPIEVPAIVLTKTLVGVPVDAASGIPGNYDATYNFEICNDGNVDLDMITLVDNINSEFGAGFVGVTTLPNIVSSTATTDPSVNNSFTGFSPNDNLLIGNDGLLGFGQCVTVQLVIEVKAIAMPEMAANQATTSATDPNDTVVEDISDDNTDLDADTNNDNETGGGEDPTLFPPLPDISTTKTLTMGEVLANGDVQLTFDFKVTNTGNTYLSMLTLDDALTFLPAANPITQNISASVTNISATTVPTINALYDGQVNDGLLLGTDGLLAPGEEFLVNLVVEVNPVTFAMIMPQPVTNQSTAGGTPSDNAGVAINDPTTGMPYAMPVTDTSDDGINTESTNPDTPGDMGTSDDPTPIFLPGIINVEKSLTGIPVPAVSAQPGNYDATYNFEICNTGGTDISNIDLVDNLNSEFGSAFVGVTTPPAIVGMSTSTPTANTNFTGFSPYDNLLSGDGTMAPGECIVVTLVIEVDADELPTPAANQAVVTGEDPMGNTITDESDDTTDLDGDTNNDNETGGEDDPTLFPYLPEISTTKQLASSTILGNGDVELNFEFFVENTGNTYLNNLSLTDALSFLPAADPSTQNISVNVLNISATSAPTASVIYDGVGSTNLLLGTDGIIAPSEKFKVTLTVEVNPVAFAMIMPQPVTNQSTALGTPVDNMGVLLNDPTTGLPYAAPVSDTSDDGFDPNTDNPGAPGDMGTTDDPTLIPLPGIIDLTKSVTSITPATKPGNALLDYTFEVCNTGGVTLVNLNLTDNFNDQFGSGFVGVTMAPTISGGTTTATANTGFTGFSPNTNLLNNNGNLLVGNCFTVTLQVEVDIDLLPENALNQALATGTDPNGDEVSDLSDDNSDLDGDTNNDNETGGEDDPTGVPVAPSINVAKSVNSVTATATPNQYEVVYRHVIQNTGNTILENISLTDDIVTALCGGYISTANISVLNTDATIAPTAAASTTVMDGLNDALNDDGLLEPGQSFIVDITVVADITTTTCTQPYLNQSTSEGLPTDGLGVALTDPSGTTYVADDITDVSDSGTDADGSNPGAPNDGNGPNIYDDPTPLALPGTIGLVKTITSTVPASSGVYGNYDVTLQFYIENTDGNNLTNLSLTDNISSQWGSAFVGVTTAPSIVTAGGDVATTDPTPNSNYNGVLDVALLNNDGELSPAEFIVVEVVVEVDASASTALGLENQATVSAVDPNGNITTDLSDDNTSSVDAPDADGDNPNGSGDEGLGGTNDPSPLYIPEISTTKTVANSVAASSGTQGNFDITYSIIVENTGTTPLENISLLDDLATQLAPAYVGMVQEAMIVSSSATVDPATGAMPNLLDGTTGTLYPGEQVTIEVIVEIDASAIPAMGLTNTASASATPTDGMGTNLPDPNNPGGTLADVSDDSDSGSTPDTVNPDEPGDTGGPDDPTPLPSLPSIEVLKAISGTPVLAASGIEGNYDVTYEFIISNDGNTALNNILLEENFNAQYGGAFVGITGTPTTTAGTINGSYTGSGINVNVLAGDATLAIGTSMTVTIVAEIDPNAAGAIFNNEGSLENQASVSGVDPDGEIVEDDSDDNTPGTPDNGTNEDPTTLQIPSIATTKALTDSELLADGTFKMTFLLKTENTGNDTLSFLRLFDAIPYVIDSSEITIIKQPTTGMLIPNDNGFANQFTGIGAPMNAQENNLIREGSGNTATLLPGDDFIIELQLFADILDLAMIDPLNNQTRAVGIANPFQIVEDLSDDGTGLANDGDPLEENEGAEGDGTGPNVYDDPTPIVLPGDIEVTKMLTSLPVPASSGTPGNFDATYNFEICNTGGVDLTAINLFDNLSNEFGNGFVGVTTAPVVSGMSTVLPTANVDYTGFTPNNNLLSGDGTMASGECVTVTLVIEVDGSELPDMAANQAETNGTDPTGTLVSDLSDDTTDLNGDTTNDNETGGEDDPTLFPAIPSISNVKQLSQSGLLANGDVQLTFEFVVENTGNTNLNQISLYDPFVFLPVAAPAMQNISVTVTNIDADIAPTANIAYDGVAMDNLLIGTDGFLSPGQKFMVTLTVNVNPVAFAMIMPQPVTNQSTAEGTPVDDMGTPVVDPTDPMGGDYAPVTDTSDDGVDPNSDNPGFPGDMGTTDDPTPITLPGAIDVTKELTSIVAGSTPGSAIATYSFVVRNIGGTDLSSISLTDDLANEFGSGFDGVNTAPSITMNVSNPLSVDPTVNATYTGYASNNDLFLGTDGLLAAGDSVTVELIVDLDMDQLPHPAFNQATATGLDDQGNTVSDGSDDVTDLDGDMTNDNETGGEDDPTGVPPFPSINVAKSINGVVQSPTSVDHYFVTYRHIVQNTGNTVLEDLSLVDDIAAALQGGYVDGSATVAVLNGDNPAQMNPTASATYNPPMDTELLIDADGILNPGENYIVDVTVEVNINTITTPPTQPLLNQSTAEGLPTDGMGNVLDDQTGTPFMDGDVTDTSDSGTDPDGNNAGAPNDTGGFDDPTPLHLPGGISVVKDIQNISSAASGIVGNYDVTIDFTIENTGSNNLTNVSLIDVLSNQWEDAFVGVTVSPTITTVGLDAGTIDPTVNPNYDGNLDSELLNNDGELAPDEFIVVQVIVEVDASESETNGLFNQATTSAIDGIGTDVSDLSDDNTASTDAADPDGDNPNGAGDDGIGGTNNPSPLYIPEISNAKEVSSILPALSGVQGNVDITFSIVVENTGTTPLENILLLDDAAFQLSPAFVGYVGTPQITSSSASIDPLTGLDDVLLDGSTGLLYPGEQVVVQFTVELDASEIPVTGLTNQATVFADPTDGMGNTLPDPNDPMGIAVIGQVSDVSDSGTDPTTENPDEPGDTGGFDDPTPIPPMPSISIAKAISDVNPAASGIDGNFDVEYTFVIENTGSANLANVSLTDDLDAQLGGAFVEVTSGPMIDLMSTAIIPGGINSSYTGEGLNTEMLDLTGSLQPGGTIIVTLVVELNPDASDAILSDNNALENQATTSANPVDAVGNPLLDPMGNPVGPVSDDSDNGTDPDTDNGEGGFDDPTPLLLPSIGVAKAITNVDEAASGIEGNYDVSVKYTVINDGNADLTDLSLIDDIVGQWSTAFVGVTTTPAITMNTASNGPTVDPMYDGTSDLLSPANTDLLEPGQTFMVEVVIEVDASMAGGTTLMNQATTTATSLDEMGNPSTVVEDDSDNGINPTGDNDEGGFDDPTPLNLPTIGLAKAAGTPAPVAGMPGIFDVEYTFIIENTGNTQLTNISLTDDFNAQFGSAFVEVTTAPAISGGTAAVPGGTNPAFTGQGAPFDEMLDGTGVLDPQENIEVTVTVRVDGSNVQDPINTLTNQAIATGTDTFGNDVSDESDYGTDPEGGDDATPTLLPCYAEIICPDVANEIVQENDFGWCAAVVTFPDATINTDCPGVTNSDVQFMLSMDAENPLTNATVAANTWMNGQPSGLMYNEGTTTVTFRVDPAVLPMDAIIDPATCSFDITIVDKQTPTVICQDINIFLDENGLATITPQDVDGGTTDNCDVPNLTIDMSEFDCSNIGLNLVTLVASDNATPPNVDSCVASVFVFDTIPPAIDVAAMDMTVDCDGTGNQTDLNNWLDSYASFSVTDNCDNEITYSYNLVSQNNLCDFTSTSTYAFIAQDTLGNTVSDTATFTIQDITAPVITTEAMDIEVVCDGDNNVTELLDWLNSNGGAVATEECSTITWTNDYGQVDPGACNGSGSITVTFTATDACGNSESTTATLTIVDDVAPIWTIDPTDLTLECTDEMDPMNAVMAWLDAAGNGDAFDSCSVVVYSNDFVALTPTCGMNNTSGTATVIFTATDACGNTATRSAVVTVEDTTPPSIDSPAVDETVECDGLGNMAELQTWLDAQGGAIFSDVCGEVTADAPVLVETIEGCGLTVKYIYSFTSTDACGNTSASTIASFVIEDTTSPMIDVEAMDNIVECNGTGNTVDLDTWLASNGGASASDVCSGTLTWSYDLVQESDLCDLTGSGLYRFTVVDECGNASTTEATFEIQDTEAPVITTEAMDIEVVCDGDNNVTELLDWLNNNGGATATDNCNEVIWTNDYGQVDPGACNGSGSITVTFTATDACGNSESTTATLTIVDDVAPIWTIDPTDLTLECTDDMDPMNAVMAWLDAAGNGDAFDSCSVVVYSNDFVALTPTCGMNNTSGTATVIFTATDACGNTATRSAEVTVEDTTPPSITSPAKDTIVECDGAGNMAELQAWLDNIAGATAEDICGEFTWNEPILMNTIEGCGLTVEYVYMFNADDACGNTSANTIASFTIEDTTSPVIDPTAMDMTVECDGMGNDDDLQMWLDNVASAGAMDECSDEPLVWEFDLITEEDSCGITGTQVYRFTVFDNCGNSSTTNGTFTIIDTIPPVITGGENYSGECDQSGANNDDELLSWLNNNAGATASDMCSSVTWTNNYHIDNWVDGCNDSENIDVTFYATDVCGNVDSITYNFSTGDNTPPVFTNCPRPPVIVDAPQGWCSAFVNFSLPLATDNCGVPIVEQTDTTGLSTGDLFPVGLTILEFTATDSCGNSTICELKVVVNDYHTPPMIECPTDTTTVNDPGVCGAVVNDISPVIDDNCPDNLAVVYEITDEFGFVIETGVEDASGVEFPGGTSTVKYTVFDQPIYLITEVLQDGTTSGVEIGNFGPASVNISCASLIRTTATDTVEYIIPNGTIVPVGGVYTYEFPEMIDAGVEATYSFVFLEREIDAITINSGSLEGDDIIRIDAIDNDDESDFIVATDCDPSSYGMYNPQLPVFTDNGTTTSLQSEGPSSASCSFNVTVLDIEAPQCAMYDTLGGTQEMLNIDPEMCFEAVISVGAGTVLDVNIFDLNISTTNAGSVTAYLTSPEGTQIKLFEGLCENTANIDIDLDDQATSSVLAVSCMPAGNGNAYFPLEELKSFYNENSEGDWVLQIYTDNPDGAVLNSWTLEVLNDEMYNQPDTLIFNDEGLCGGEFTWMHPVFKDNCCEGSMTVTYTFSNDVTGVTYEETENVLTPTGFVDLDGTEVTKYFEVGTTVVTYNLIDLAGNESQCGFTITVEDDEVPMFNNSCGDVTYFLEPGDCTSPLLGGDQPIISDNCAIDSVTYCDADGNPLDIDFLPIGEYEITVKVTDIYGNTNSCVLTANIIEYEPDNDVLTCNGAINLSLDVNCMAIVTADMILEGGPYGCYDNYCIEVTNSSGVIVDNVFDLSDVGQTFQVSIIDCLGGGNSCWGEVTIEEKLIPEIECPADVTIYCNQDPEARDELTDTLLTGELKLLTCEPNAAITYTDDVIDNGSCSSPRVEILRRWRLIDASGNQVTCDQIITVAPYDPLNVEFPQDYNLENAFSCGDLVANPDTTLPEYTGYPSLNGNIWF